MILSIHALIPPISVATFPTAPYLRASDPRASLHFPYCAPLKSQPVSRIHFFFPHRIQTLGLCSMWQGDLSTLCPIHSPLEASSLNTLYTKGHPQLTTHSRGEPNGTETSPEDPGMTLQF